MCGICGQFNFGEGGAPVDAAVIRRMTGTLVHRGPDDEGYFISDNIGLGFRRLSIIDIKGGHQPMCDPEETIWVIFNGEIYNFKEIRAELEARGHVFRTMCDTEVIVLGYKEWGKDFLKHLNGMFGLAVWDARKKKLIIARDPMGIKLVYYRLVQGSVYFGSEMRAILAAFSERPNIDTTSLNLFFRYRYTPSPFTLFEDIRKLAPGTLLEVENGICRTERWYRFAPTPFDSEKGAEIAQAELLELYKRAVKRHLMSDVPLGLLLSGGIDSALLLALMNRHGGSWPTFTVGYGKSFKYDELVDAAETAKILSARNVLLELDIGTFETALPKVVSFLEEPIASSSIVPMYFLCERARQDVKVALMGQGPDELFGGYRRHMGVHYGAYWRRIPQWLRKPAEFIINKLPRNETLKRGVYALAIPERMKRYQNVFSILPGQLVDSLFQEDLLPPDAGDRILDCWSDLAPLMEETDELGGLQFLEIRSSLPDELLMYADKLSMAHGLEVRVPYLDREIVEYVERLRSHFKVRNFSQKWLHRKVCEDFLPRSIIQRKKRGFAVNVVDEWFRKSLSGKMDDILLEESSVIYRYLNRKVVSELLGAHKAGSQDNHKILFSIVVLEIFLRSKHEVMSMSLQTS